MMEIKELASKDLVVLVADKDMGAVLAGLLERSMELGIRAITYDVYVHPRRDPGCRREAAEFLRPLSANYRCALVLFDHEGSGGERTAPQPLADERKLLLERNGWAGRADVVVVAPELEVWVWTNSPDVPRCLGWEGRKPPLRQWLADTGRWSPSATKPPRPKEAFLDALRQARKPRSSAIYQDLAQSVGLLGHAEPSFVRLTGALRTWFPP